MFGDARSIVHAALSGVMAWLAMVLMLPHDTFGTNVTFRVMAGLATEDHWAVAFWLVAAVGVAGLTTASLMLRLLSVLLLATMHGVIAICFVLANPFNTGTGTYAIIALMGYELAWRRAYEGV